MKRFLHVRSAQCRRALAWLVVAIGTVSTALLLLALHVNGGSARTFQDARLSGSLRDGSLNIYTAFHTPAALPSDADPWMAKAVSMRGIREDLRRRYSQAVKGTDPAWELFSVSLSRTGQVDWQTAAQMYVAADVLTRTIEREAIDQEAFAGLLLRVGLAGLLGSLAAWGLVLAGLRSAETELQQALGGLGNSRSLFLQSLDAVQEGFVVQDQNSTILLCNAGAERLLGITAKEFTGQSAEHPEWQFVRENGEEFPRSQHPSRLALRTAEPQEAVVIGIQRPGVDILWLSMKAAPVFQAGQTMPYAAVLTFSDITAQKKSEAEKTRIEADLQIEREFQQAMLESLQSGIVACNAEGILTLFNRAARDFHGMPEQALPPDQWTESFDLYRPDGITPLPTEEIPLFRAFQGEIVRDTEMVIAPKDAPSRTLTASGQAIYGSQGEKLGAVVAMHDITVRRRIERELSRLAAIVESSEEAILAMTLDGTLVSWNAGAERLYGYAESEVIGQHVSVLVPSGEDNPVDAVIPRLMRGESTEPIEVVRQHRSGATLSVALTFSPIHDAEGDVIGLSCIARDVSARRQAEDALRESESRLRYLSEAAFEGISVSSGGVIVDANPAFLSLFGYESMAQVVGQTSETFVVFQDRSLVLQKITAEEEDTYEALCLRGDGTTFQAELRGRKILWGGLPARVTAVRDVSERKVMEEALKESQRFAHSVAENSASLIFVFDLETQSIVYSNRDVAEFLGYATGEFTVSGIDQLTSIIHPEDMPRLLRHLEEFRDLEDGHIVEFEYRVRQSSGEWRWLWNREVIFKRHPGGSSWQILSNAQDVTARREMEEALRRSEEALRAMMSSAPVILYAADASGIVTLSEGTGLAALGLMPGEAVGHSIFEFTGGDPLLDENSRRALAGETVSCDARIGALCLHTEIRPQRDLCGLVTGIIGVCFDITERAQSEERFRVLFEQSSDAHLLFDDTGIIDCNHAAVALMHCAAKSQLLALHSAALSPERQPDGQRSDEKCIAMDAAARRKGEHRFEWVYRRMDGGEFPVEVSLTPVTLAGNPVMLVVWHDLTERKKAEQEVRDHAVVLEFQKSQLEAANRELEALATTDGLTGLKNHRTFQEKLAEEHMRASRYHQPLSLLLLDVDQFKSFNDSFGHPAGDAVLIGVAAILGRTARDTDIAARYGGEEFVVILPQTDEAGAIAIAERIRVAVAEENWAERTITVSLGVCTLSLDTPTPSTMVASADRALYQSKKMGRNRVSHGSSDTFLSVPSASDAEAAGHLR